MVKGTSSFILFYFIFYLYTCLWRQQLEMIKYFTCQKHQDVFVTCVRGKRVSHARFEDLLCRRRPGKGRKVEPYPHR